MYAVAKLSMLLKEIKQVGIVVVDSMIALLLASLAYVVVKYVTPEAALQENTYLDLCIHLLSVTLVVYVILRLLNTVRRYYMPKNLISEAGNVILVSVAVLLVDWDKLKTVVDRFT